MQHRNNRRHFSFGTVADINGNRNALTEAFRVGQERRRSEAVARGNALRAKHGLAEVEPGDPWERLAETVVRLHGFGA